MSKSLTISERREYNQRTKHIKEWTGDRFAVGEDLVAVRDKKLYRDDYQNFDSYVETEFQIKRSQAYRLMDAVEVKHSLGTSPIGDKIKNEGQARALAIVPPAKRAAVVRAASKNGNVTAASITAAAAKLIVSPANELVWDKDGYPVPSPALPSWNRREEMKDHLGTIKAALQLMKKLDPEDSMLVEVNMQSVISDLNNAYQTFKQAIPEHVCGVCQGQTPKTCALCKGRGVISDFRWISVPTEVKKIRAMSIGGGK